MENFEYPYNEADVGKLTDRDGNALLVSDHLLRQIARQVAPSLALEELAFIMHKVADHMWAESVVPQEKLLASEVHHVAAELLGMDAKWHAHLSNRRR